MNVRFEAWITALLFAIGSVAQLLSLKAAPVLCNACLRPLHSNLGSKVGTAPFMNKYE